MLLRVTVIIFLFCSFSFNEKRMDSGINIHISNLKNQTSSIRIAVYRASDNFPDEKKFYRAFVYNYSGSGSINYTISGLEEGEYAFAFFQDLNNNGKLNTNIFGYPKEPFCFSNNIKPLIKAPSFNECKVLVKGQSNTLNVKMIR